MNLTNAINDSFTQYSAAVLQSRALVDVRDCCKPSTRQILYCIEHHEDKNWNGNNVSDINTLILQDADNIDAIGAIGIGRGFIYGNQYKQPQYIENIPFEDFEGYEEKIKDVSLMHFFHNKLIKLGKNMNTETAKEIASERIRFVELFIDEFIKEWNAKF